MPSLSLPVSSTSVLLLLVCLSLTSFSSGEEAAVSANDGTDPRVTIACSVTNEAGQPIKHANIKLFKWTGIHEDTGVESNTDAMGESHFSFNYSDNQFHLFISAKGFAATLRSLQAQPGETQNLAIRLRQSASPWVQVTRDGKPLAGAELSRVDVTEADGNKMYLLKKNAVQLGYDFSTSDSSGRLILPAIPQGSQMDVWVVHPDRKAVKLEALQATNDQLASIEMDSGVPITLELSIEGEDIADLEGHDATISMISRSGSPSLPENIQHAFSIHDGKVAFTANQTEYGSLQVDIAGYFATPYWVNFSEHPNPQIDLSEGKPSTLKVVLRRKVKMKGRIVDNQGNGLKGAYVSSVIANNTKHSEATTENEANHTTTDSNESFFDWVDDWSPSGSSETDKDGNYEIEVALGRVKLENIFGWLFLPRRID